MSLKAALERIGYGPCFHMIDLIQDPTTLHHWQAAAQGERVDWETVFDGWEATVDWPGCTYAGSSQDRSPRQPQDPQGQTPRQKRYRDELGDEIRDDDGRGRRPEQPALSGAFHLPLWPCT